MKNPFIGLFRSRDKPRNAISAAETFYFGSSMAISSIRRYPSAIVVCMELRRQLSLRWAVQTVWDLCMWDMNSRLLMTLRICTRRS